MIAEAENKLKAMLGDASTGKTSLNKVYWVNSKWSGLDEKLLKTDQPKIYETYYKTKPTRRFKTCKL